MSGLTPREHALRVAVLEAITEMAKAEYAKARADAQLAFAAVRADGGKQQAVMLPDGTEIGMVSIKAGVTDVTADDAELLAWVREHVPDGIESYIDPAALTDAEVIDMIRACFPGAVKERVRGSTRAALVAEMIDSGGFVTDKETGEIELLGMVESHKPTGAFALNGSGAKQRRERIVAEWQRGKLWEIALGPLALPQGGAAGE